MPSPPPVPSAPTGLVFLSYAHEDAAEVLRLAASLRAAGIAVWFDEHEIGRAHV